ncbi:hypothetical protein BRC62_02340 [Halobacteriales archaeon QH_10_67_13]|nr:MAG: hypothetical protein BRC62_02340 [Halobacteriales archaeon QH_10_67_13]
MERRRLLGGFGCLLAATAGCVTADRDDPAETGDGDEAGEETNGSTSQSRSDDESDREPESNAGGVDSDGEDDEGDAPADGSDGGEDDRSDSVGRATELTGRRVETRSQNCLDGDSEVPRAAVTREGSETIVDGAAQTSNPCHEAAFERVAYDADAGVLTVDLTFESTASVCKQCVGVVEYRCVFEFAGGLPERVVVRHDGHPVTETA